MAKLLRKSEMLDTPSDELDARMVCLHCDTPVEELVQTEDSETCLNCLKLERAEIDRLIAMLDPPPIREEIAERANQAQQEWLESQGN